jgi:hypothetical protein
MAIAQFNRCFGIATEVLMLATMSEFFGNVWFAALVGCVGFGFGWYMGNRKNK